MSWSSENSTLTPSASGIVARNSASPPVNVMRMAAELGILVKSTSALPNDVSGRIFKSSLAQNGYCIEINANDSTTRQRFTLAHEIAHYVLHRDLIGDGISDDAMYRSSLSSEYEVQANRYAAEILLPTALLKREYRACPALAVLSKTFGVSEEALRIRIKQLGLGV
jgi:Zn-dependent peptidase ImmA (M78 family)